MKVCVVGAGAIGGYMAVRLADAGHDISVIARGPHLAAIKANGLKLIEAEQELIASNLVASDKIADLGNQDVVVMALKAHQIIPVVKDLPVLFGPNTVMVTLQNGIPWWYFQKYQRLAVSRTTHGSLPEHQHLSIPFRASKGALPEHLSIPFRVLKEAPSNSCCPAQGLLRNSARYLSAFPSIQSHFQGNRH